MSHYLLQIRYSKIAFDITYAGREKGAKIWLQKYNWFTLLKLVNEPTWDRHTQSICWLRPVEVFTLATASPLTFHTCRKVPAQVAMSPYTYVRKILLNFTIGEGRMKTSIAIVLRYDKLMLHYFRPRRCFSYQFH